MAKQCEDLPEECWGIILKKLDHHSDFQSLSLVSKSFLALTNRLRLNFTVTNQTILLHGTISKFLNRFNHLKTLDFSKFKGNVDAILDTVFNCGLNIECLDVSNQEKLPVLTEKMRNLKVFKCAKLCCLSDSDLVSISVMLPFLEELDISYPNNGIFEYRSLKLEEYMVTDIGMEALWSSLRKLRRVNVSGNHFITDRSVVGLSKNCLLLSEIVMLNCSFITCNAFHFIVCNCHHLNVISVNRIQIPPLVSSTYVRALHSIDLSETLTISDESLISIAKACWPLESLSLRSLTSFTLFGISQLLCAYRSLKNLALVEALFLTDQSVIELAQYLVNLVSINLNSCFRLTALTFVRLVTECPLLEHIEMSGTSVGNVDHFLVVKNKKIKSLNLSKNSLSDNLLKCIASTCPNMEVLNISSTYRTTEIGIADVLKICHRIRNLKITDCAGVNSLGAGSKLPTLEVLNVAKSGFGDEGLKTISQRCPGLLKLDMEGCVAATTKQVEELLRMCERLREINLKGCCSVKVLSVANTIMSLRRSYLKVIPPSTLPFNNCHRHLWSHGCLLE